MNTAPSPSFIYQIGDMAQRYASHGFAVFPCSANTKQPLTLNGYHDATTDPAIIARLWEKYPDANIAVACATSGLVLLDGDPYRYDDESRAFIDNLQKHYPTVTAKTPTLGPHLFYRLPPDVKLTNSNKGLPLGIDIKVNGYGLLAPSSVTYYGEHAKNKGVPDGYCGQYSWLPGLAPDECVPSPLPQIVIDKLLAAKRPSKQSRTEQSANGSRGQNDYTASDSAYGLAALKGEQDKLANTLIGGRNNQLNLSAFKLGQLISGDYLDQVTVEDELLEVAIDIGLSESEARATIASGIEAGKAEPRSAQQSTEFRMTEVGNTRRLVEYYGDRIRYVHEWDMWLIWDGRRWVEDKSFEVERYAKVVISEIFKEAATLTGNEREALWRWGKASEKQASVTAMVRSARSEPGIAISHRMLESKPLLLNVRNGIIDLRTGKLLPHDRNRFITKLIDVEYDPSARCPLWLAFLDKIQNSDLETIEFLQRAVGYTLTGTSREKMWLFMFGAKGNNGKSTFIEALMALMGDYAVKLPMQTLLQSNFGSGRIRNDLADIYGARLVVASEAEKGKQLNESLMKDLTGGGDTITANFLYKRNFQFPPTHVMWMYGNHKPIIQGTDDSIWSRVRLIPFEVKIPDSEIDTSFPEKLRAELPGILAWAVEGCLKWQEVGLMASRAVLSGTSQYRRDMDPLGRFLDEMCVVGVNPRTHRPYEVPYRTLYMEYLQWCGEQGEVILTKPEFTDALAEKGFERFSGTGNAAMRRGVGLKANVAI